MTALGIFCAMAVIILSLDCITGVVLACTRVIEGRPGMAMLELNSALWRGLGAYLIAYLYLRAA